MNGHAFLSLTESRLEHVGVSFGFQIQVIDILENLVRIVDHLVLTIDHRRGREIGNACSMRVTLCIDLYMPGFGHHGSSHSIG